MKQFTFSDLSRRSGDVLDTALGEPVSLMKRGKPKIVMMPAEHYERLVRPIPERSAFTLADASDEDVENLMTGFREIINEGERSGG